MQYLTLDTPIGPFTAIVNDAGSVLGSGFTPDVDALLPLIHPDLKEEVRPPENVGHVADAVTSYLDGDLPALDEVEVLQRTGGIFLGHAWDVMREIKPGAPVTYTQFAEMAGRPSAVRGAASACARNAAALFAPCHRVLRTDGALGGYRWGLDVKRWLLEHESAG